MFTINKMRVLVFDTETTGLPKSNIINNTTLNLWPHIVQFSYIVFDTETNSIVSPSATLIDDHLQNCPMVLSGVFLLSGLDF